MPRRKKDIIDVPEEIIDVQENTSPITKDVSEPSGTDKLLLELVTLTKQSIENQNSLSQNMVQMNNNLIQGYQATQKILQEGLAVINAPKKETPPPSPQGNVTNNPEGYYQPTQAPAVSQNNTATVNGQPVPSSVQGNGWGNLPPEVIVGLVDKFLGNQQNAQNNIFSMLGQRMFAEMVTTNMMTNRALIRNMHAKGALTKEEADSHLHLQEGLYAPFIGSMMGNGQPQQPIAK